MLYPLSFKGDARVTPLHAGDRCGRTGESLIILACFGTA